MLRLFALLFALVYGLIGILGFSSLVKEDHLLFSIFKVNAWTSGLSLVFALLALWITFKRETLLLIFFQICGVLLAIWAVLGFVYDDQPIFDLVANNAPLTWLHVITAVVALILGFGSKEDK